MNFNPIKINNAEYLIPSEIAERFSDKQKMVKATQEKLGCVVSLGDVWHKSWWSNPDEPIRNAVVVYSDGYRDRDQMIIQRHGVWCISHLLAGSKGTTLAYLPLSNVYKYWNNEKSSEEIVAADQTVL